MLLGFKFGMGEIQGPSAALRPNPEPVPICLGWKLGRCPTSKRNPEPLRGARHFVHPPSPEGPENGNTKSRGLPSSGSNVGGPSQFTGLPEWEASESDPSLELLKPWSAAAGSTSSAARQELIAMAQPRRGGRGRAENFLVDLVDLVQ